MAEELTYRVNHRDEVFIVRLWHEASAQSAGEWRGSVEHVPSGKRVYFKSLGGLNDFIARQMMNEQASAQSKQ